MIKNEEITNPSSCLNRAVNHERLFVLLARDACAPETIRFWVQRRIRTGKNKPDDAVILEAKACADAMDAERAALRTSIGKSAA